MKARFLSPVMAAMIIISTEEKIKMITLTKLDGTIFALNSDLIETVVENPDTTVHLTIKKFYIVKESMDEVVEKVIDFRKEVNGVLNRI